MDYSYCQLTVVLAFVTRFLGALKKKNGSCHSEQIDLKYASESSPQELSNAPVLISEVTLCCSQSRVDFRLRRHFTEKLGLSSTTSANPPNVVADLENQVGCLTYFLDPAETTKNKTPSVRTP